MLSPTATRYAMRSDNRPPLPATAGPGVADPVQPVAAEPGVMRAQADSSHGDVVPASSRDRVAVTWEGHYDDLPSRPSRSYHPCVPVTRLCLACGVIRECDPGLRCAECDASPFHLIPLAPASS